VYSFFDIMKFIILNRFHFCTHGRREEECRVLVGIPEGKRPLGRPRRIWENGIRKGFRETGWGSVEWIQLAQDRAGGGLL
jgi:hypothetical protein